MQACSRSRGPLNVRIFLCNSSNLDSIVFLALAYLLGAVTIGVLVLTELEEKKMCYQFTTQNASLSWQELFFFEEGGAYPKTSRMTSDADLYKGSVVYASSSSSIVLEKGGPITP